MQSVIIQPSYPRENSVRDPPALSSSIARIRYLFAIINVKPSPICVAQRDISILANRPCRSVRAKSTDVTCRLTAAYLTLALLG